MDPFLKRRVGRTAFEVTQLGMGGASLGDARETGAGLLVDGKLKKPCTRAGCGGFHGFRRTREGGSAQLCDG